MAGLVQHFKAADRRQSSSWSWWRYTQDRVQQRLPSKSLTIQFCVVRLTIFIKILFQQVVLRSFSHLHHRKKVRRSRAPRGRNWVRTSAHGLHELSWLGVPFDFGTTAARTSCGTTWSEAASFWSSWQAWYDGLARILTKVEEVGVWPDGLLDAYIVMTPKTEGDATPLGQRPLSVLPIVHRI